MNWGKSIPTRDVRLRIGCGHGRDAIQINSIDSCAITLRHHDQGQMSTGRASTPSEGNQLVCEAARWLRNGLSAKRSQKSGPGAEIAVGWRRGWFLHCCGRPIAGRWLA